MSVLLMFKMSHLMRVMFFVVKANVFDSFAMADVTIHDIRSKKTDKFQVV